MKTNRGFTLIELLIAVAITGILGVAITTLYINNLRVNTAQTTVVRVQQNIRATTDYLARQIRMAGYNGASTTAGAGIDTATEGQFEFTILNETTNTLDRIDVLLDVADDADNDGVVDSGIANNTGAVVRIQMNGAGGYQPLAENIHAIGFAYAFAVIPPATVTDPDPDPVLVTHTSTSGNKVVSWAIPDPSGGGGNWMRLDSNGDGLITIADDGDGDGSLDLVDTGIVYDAAMIRAVKVSVLGTSHRSSQDYLNSETYIVGRHVLTPNDSIRRRLLTTSVACRNMGLLL